MADLVPILLSFPPETHVGAKEYDKQILTFVKELGKISEAQWAKAVGKQGIFDLLNPAVNTLSYLYALCIQVQAAGSERTLNEEALMRVFIFFTSFDPVQVRYAGDRWLSLLEYCFEVFPRLGLVDLSPLCAAMLRLDPTAGTFTSSHLRLVRLALEAGVPSQALPILDKNIYAFPQTPAKSLPDELLCDEHDLSNFFITSKSGMSVALMPEYVLEYYLLGASIYMSLRDDARARLFLEYVILTPVQLQVCSALQLEAYKKWVLLGLLTEGKMFPLPRTAEQQVIKSLRALSKAYEALAESFERRDRKKYQAEMEVGAQIWHDDGNMRLVKEVGDALLRYRVIDLQRTYATLPVSRVATHLNLSPSVTQTLLTDMVRQGELSASITSSPDADAVLLFHPSKAREADLRAQTARIQDLVSYIRDADRRLQLSKEYVESARRQKRSAAGPDGDLADQMDLTWDAPIPGVEEDGDEDIMAS